MTHSTSDEQNPIFEASFLEDRNKINKAHDLVVLAGRNLVTQVRHVEDNNGSLLDMSGNRTWPI